MSTSQSKPKTCICHNKLIKTFFKIMPTMWRKLYLELHKQKSCNSVSQEVCCHKGNKHPGADNILTKHVVLIHKACCCHNSMYTSSYPYHDQDARHFLLLLYILHCLGSGTSCLSGSSSDCRNVFPFISFVVAITNSTSAAKGGKRVQLLVPGQNFDQVTGHISEGTLQSCTSAGGYALHMQWFTSKHKYLWFRQSNLKWFPA